MTRLTERLSKNEDKELHQLLTACRRNPNTKRLILTTREYLYEQARQQSEVLSKRAAIETGKSTVELKDYTDKIRAKILVNHLYFFGVDSEVCSRFVKSGAARKTLEHANYNPRIVEAMCNLQSFKPVGGHAFGKRFLQMLDSPGEIWEHAYRNHLSENARSLLLVFAMHGSAVTVDGLRHHFRIYADQSNVSMVGFEAFFSACLKELEGTFVNVTRSKHGLYVGYHSPAIKDFTDAELARDSHVLTIALRSFTYEGVLLFVANQLITIAASAVDVVVRMGGHRRSGN